MTRATRIAALLGLLTVLAAGAGPVPPDDPSTGAIEGVVVDEAGRPLAGAVVYPPPLVSGRPASATTAADGSFRLVHPFPRSNHFWLYARSADGTRQTVRYLELPDGGTLGGVRLTARPAAPVAVRVTDAAGRPVAGAEVYVFQKAQELPLPRATTDAGGSAALLAPADAVVSHVVALKPGVGFDYVENYLGDGWEGPAPPPARADLVLDGASPVRLRLADAAGRPLAGPGFLRPDYVRKPGKRRAVCLYMTASTAFAPPSDARGVVSFDWMPARLEGGVSFLNRYSPDHATPEGVTFEPWAPAEVKVVVRRAATVRGTVTGPDGRPAAGVGVEAWGWGRRLNPAMHYARTAADGTYAMKVTPGASYVVAPSPGGLVAPARTGVLPQEGDDRAGVDFRLGPGTAVEGRVTAGPAKTPLAGQQLTVQLRGGKLPQELLPRERRPDERFAWEWMLLNVPVETDKDGRFRLPVAPGTYKVDWYAAGATQLVEAGDGSPAVCDFHADRPPRLPLRVTVRRPGGEPVAGAVVTGAYGPRGPYHPPFRAEAADGTVRTEVWSDPLVLYAASRDGALAGLTRVGPGEAGAEVVARPAARLTGRVVGPGGRPLGGVRVFAQVADDPSWEYHGTPCVSARTGPDGRFAAPGVPVARYCRVLVFGYDHFDDAPGEASADVRVSHKGKWYSPALARPAFRVRAAGPLDLGDLAYDPDESK